MSAGYGRGYYGDEQLAPRRGGGWLTAVIVVGAGAAIWFLWPRKAELKPESVTTTTPPMPDGEIGQIARSQGFSSMKTFEDSVVATARELQASGAKIDLGPHLAHLTPRLGDAPLKPQLVLESP